jgi:hypothetical protein
VSTRNILGTVGAVIGAYFGSPQLGWMIGSTIGGAIDPEIIKGPSIGDIAAQTSQEGTPRPITFALSPPMAGNIIASSEPKIVRKSERQGKGGPKVETESVYRTYAIGVCEGPITRFVRVWRNGQLVYDIESAEMTEEHEIHIFGQTIPVGTQNTKFLGDARFFLGDWDQEPSPDLETVFGVGTTPAHRGTAYMVMADEDLTDLRGAIPQYQFQVERCEGFYLTSRPYAVEAADAVASPLLAPTQGRIMGLGIEGMTSLHVVPMFGELYGGLVEYEDAEPEAMESAQVEPLFGEIYGDLITYDDWPPEGIDSELAPLDGTLE